ncbi:light-harvesting antenna LH1, beta subunit [Thiorhodospira sibirica]|uniref:light-harvesting antenna LH1, beta subunit n=1 Tax=Thiorhodospira sibirica TaxID=154347 RepID=UPI00022C1D1B|nr:light-harvesting antenna LH1, beta subunit [Thiorhodospira sibirica]
MADKSVTGLTEDEALEFHGIFMMSFAAFILVAIVAHFLAWSWRPWIPGPEGYSWQVGMIVDQAKVLAQTYVPFAFTNLG